MTAKIFQVLMVAAVYAFSQAATAAPVTWTTNGHQYEFIRITASDITWTDANAAASALGGGWHLATVTSEDEENFIESLLPSSPAERAHVWLGGQVLSNGSWGSWVTGETWGFEDWWTVVVSNEPNGGLGEPYLALDFRGGWAWNDVSNNLTQTYGCCYAIGYVIERSSPEQPLPEPGTLALLGLGLAGLAALRRRKR